MRGIGLTIAALVAIPAIVIPLLACTVVFSAPAALIAGIAALSRPDRHDSDVTDRQRNNSDHDTSSRTRMVRHEDAPPPIGAGQTERSRQRGPDEKLTGM